MEYNLIRLLRADEIECRIALVKEKGLSLLLYKDARVDQRILDETFGIFGWKRSHQCINGNLYCTVEVYHKETGEWVAKQDVGTTGYTEKEKSQASDSFKRACFNWGIGRELYSAPFIWIPADKAEIRRRTKDGKDAYYCNDRFLLSSIAYNGEREIIGLSIMNSSRNQVVYELKGHALDNGQKAGTEKDGCKKGGISKEQMASLQSELKRTGVAMDAVKDRYKIGEPEEMSEELYHRVMMALSKTRPAA